MSRLRFKLLWSNEAKTGAFSRMRFVRVIVDETGAGTQRVVAIDAPRTLRLLACVGVLLWLGAVFGLAHWLNRNPHNRVTSVDLLLPWRWRGIPELRAQAHLAAGREALRAQRYADGVFLIRAGLRGHPHDPESRLALAEVYASSGYWPEAKNVLLPELDWDPSRNFLRFVFEQAARFEDWSFAVATSERLLARPGLSDADRNWLAEQKVTALFSLQRFEEIVTAVGQQPPPVSFFVQQYRILALCRLHRSDEAIALAESLKWPAAFQPMQREMLATSYRSAGRIDDFKRVLAGILADHPMEPVAWIFSMEQWWLAGLPAEAERALDGFLLRFEVQPNLLLMAATRCSNLPAPALAARCAASARDRGRPARQLELLHALALIRSGDVPGFERSFGLILADKSKPDPSEAALIAWMESLQNAARTGRDEALLEKLRRARQQLLRDTLTLLEAAKQWPSVEAVATIGQDSFPNEAGFRQRREFAAAQRAAAKPVELPAPPKRPIATATQAEAKESALPKALPVESAAELWSKLDDLTARNEWEQAADLIRSVNVAAPPWLVGNSGELEWRDARVTIERNDARRVRRIVSERLSSQRQDVGRAIALVDVYVAQGNMAAARALMETIMERVPESVLARKRQKELAP